MFLKAIYLQLGPHEGHTSGGQRFGYAKHLLPHGALARVHHMKLCGVLPPIDEVLRGHVKMELGLKTAPKPLEKTSF